MKIRRPRTLLGLTLVGLAVVTVPLLIAIANAAMQLGRLATASEAVAEESATTSVEAQRIWGFAQNLERVALQFLVVPNEDSLAAYDDDRAKMSESIRTLRALPQSAVVAEPLQRLAELADATRDALSIGTQPDPALQGVMQQNLGAMRSAANEIREGLRVSRNAQLRELQEGTREAQQTLMWQTALLIPGTVVLVLFFLIVVGRPMRQVDRAIRQLGTGDFGQTIAVKGPSDLETLGRQLEWLRHRLKESTEEKNKFLRHMSHELKTPLANIREGTELLLDGSVGPLETQQQEVTSILRDNGVKLQQLIENLLNFSAWQTKTASLEVTEFELKPLVFSVLSRHRLLISNQKIKLQLAIRAMCIRADEGKLRLVLENLISNAIKFLPNGGVIHVSAEMRGNEFVLDVADTGPGVAPEDRHRIFEAFYQGRRPQGGPLGGTGIGLSVVAECVQAHGGEIRLLENSEWPGAHFHVRLPLRRQTDRPQLAVANG